MTHKIQFNASSLGALALNAAQHVYNIDNGSYGKDRYDRLLALINVLRVDYLAASQLDQPLGQVLNLWRAGESLEKMGELMLNYLDEYALKDE